jgi:hypothetical protein
MDPQSCSDDRRLESPATSNAELLLDSEEAASTTDSDSNRRKHGEIKGAQKSKDGMVYRGRRTVCTGLEHTSTRPSRCYKPAPGIITLFNKTGTGRRDPKSLTRSTTPLKQPEPHSRSYTEVVRSGMDGNGKYGNGAASNGSRGNGIGGFHGQTQGDAYTRPGYQRPYQRYGAAGFHGSLGGGRHYDQHGRGFGGNFRQSEFRASYGDQRQMTAPLRDLGVHAWPR